MKNLGWIKEKIFLENLTKPVVCDYYIIHDYRWVVYKDEYNEYAIQKQNLHKVLRIWIEDYTDELNVTTEKYLDVADKYIKDDQLHDKYFKNSEEEYS